MCLSDLLSYPLVSMATMRCFARTLSHDNGARTTPGLKAGPFDDVLDFAVVVDFVFVQNTVAIHVLRLTIVVQLVAV